MLNEEFGNVSHFRAVFAMKPDQNVNQSQSKCEDVANYACHDIEMAASCKQGQLLFFLFKL